MLYDGRSRVSSLWQRGSDGLYRIAQRYLHDPYGTFIVRAADYASLIGPAPIAWRYPQAGRLFTPDQLYRGPAGRAYDPHADQWLTLSAAEAQANRNATWQAQLRSHQSWWARNGALIVEGEHLFLNAVGMIPGLGVLADLVNAGFYAIEGRWSEAGLSALAAIPGIGYTANVARYGSKATRLYRASRAVDVAINLGLSGYAGYSGIKDLRAGHYAAGGLELGLGLFGAAVNTTAAVKGLRRLRAAHGVAPVREGLATNADEAVFWSGIRNGETTAAQWAGRNAGATLESTMAARGIKLPAWDPANPASVAAWRQASQQFAAGASGNVRVLQGNAVRLKSVWAEVEFPALKANPNVKSIIGVSPETGPEVLLWAQ